MSETQTEYDTDAGPTPGSWEHDLKPMDGVDGRSIFGQDEDGNMFVIANVNVPGQGLLQGDWRENARLIAAAGTAAHELPDEYDPVRAVEELPEGLDTARRAIIDLQEAHTSGPPEDSVEAAAQAASHRLKVFMAEAGADETMIPGDSSVALAIAEGREDG